MTLAIFVVGHMSADLWLLTRQLPGALTRAAIAVVYYLLPNLERFNFRAEVVHDLAIPGAAVGWAVVYAIAFVIVVLFLANLRFRNKDLK
jgi:ABC-type transport system involved in multi-copper enzyme maturation permease subunit